MVCLHGKIANERSGAEKRENKKISKSAGERKRTIPENRNRPLRFILLNFYAIAANFCANLDFLLAALFLWNKPSEAALSIADAAAE